MDAATRPSILASYAHAFAEILGAAPAEDAETAGSRFVTWLAEANQPWLVVLDDLTNAADLAGLWPQRPAGCVLVTALHGASLPGEFGAMAWPVGLFSAREALAYALARLPSDPDQRAGVAEPGGRVELRLVLVGEGHGSRDRRQAGEGARGASSPPRPPTTLALGRPPLTHCERGGAPPADTARGAGPAGRGR